MTLRPRRVVVPLAVTLALLAACGAGRPAVADLQTGLTADTSLFPVAEQQTACAAELLLDTDLSDDALRAIAQVDHEFEFSAQERSTMAEVQVQVLTTCGG